MVINKPKYSHDRGKSHHNRVSRKHNKHAYNHGRFHGKHHKAYRSHKPKHYLQDAYIDDSVTISNPVESEIVVVADVHGGAIGWWLLLIPGLIMLRNTSFTFKNN